MDDPFKSDPFKINSLEDPPFNRSPFDPEKTRESIRGAITVVAMVIFAIIAAFYLYAALTVSNDAQWNHIKEATQVILPAVTSVLGTALGFYFGSQKK